MWRAPEGQAAVPVGGGGAWPDNEPTRRETAAAQDPLVWRAPEGPEDAREPGCGARGRWRGQSAMPVDGNDTTASQISHVI